MKKIMVIDDEKDFCFFLKKNLEASGDFEVTACSESVEALAIAKEVRPDLIFLDVMMPRKDGSVIAAELRKEELTKDIPLVFLTAAVKNEEIKKHKSIIGGEFFIAKPVEIGELLRTIGELLA